MKRLFLFFALAALFSMPVMAQTAGYDLLQTGSGASVDLSSIGLGVVPLHGLSILSSLGNTDTIMHRTANGPGVVPLNIYALFMESNNPVTFNNQSCDVYVTINNSGGNISTSVLPQPDALSESTGNVTIRTDGTFDSSFTVHADLIFVKAGTPVTDPNNYVGHQAAPSNPMSSSNSSWSKTPSPGYPSSSSYPSGGFYPKPVHLGPHPVVPASCPPSGGAPSRRVGAALAKACIAAL